MMFRPLTNNRLIKVMLRNLMHLIRGSRQTTLSTRILDDFGNHARPPGLMGCADAAARVAVKVLEEEDVIAEVGVVVHLAVEGVDGPLALIIAEEEVHETLIRS